MSFRRTSCALLFLLCGIGLAARVRVDIVYDGDTFRSTDSAVVRLLGIDAPESYQPGGDVARDILEKYVAGREVRLESDSADKDQYGRLLRYVYVGDTMVNLEMVRKGYAAFRMFQATLKYQDTLAKAEEEAARTGRGLWSFNVFAPPSIELLKEKVRAESLKADSGKPGIRVVSWLDAGQYQGKLVTVDGTVVATYNSGKVCHLNFHEDYRKYFSVAVFSQDFPKFPAKPEDYYLKRHVRVTGIVKDYKGAPEIIATDEGQIEVLR
jgi:micrococcal nuclease